VRALGGVAVLVPVDGVFVLDRLSRPGGPLTSNRAFFWAVGDLVLYSVFLTAGFLHREGAYRRVSRRGWMVLAILAAAAATACRLTQPVPLGVVTATGARWPGLRRRPPASWPLG